MSDSQELQLLAYLRHEYGNLIQGLVTRVFVAQLKNPELKPYYNQVQELLRSHQRMGELVRLMTSTEDLFPLSFWSWFSEQGYLNSGDHPGPLPSAQLPTGWNLGWDRLSRWIQAQDPDTKLVWFLEENQIQLQISSQIIASRWHWPTGLEYGKIEESLIGRWLVQLNIQATPTPTQVQLIIPLKIE